MIQKIKLKLFEITAISLCMLLILNCKENKGLDISDSEIAPDFRLDDIEHKRFYLNQHKDKNIVLVFWATWCVICKKYLNDLEKLKTDLNKKNTIIVSVLTDPENKDILNEILKNSVHITFPVLLDRKQVIMERYGAKKMPTTILIGRNNEIIMKRIGYNSLTIEQIQNKLDLLLENK